MGGGLVAVFFYYPFSFYAITLPLYDTYDVEETKELGDLLI